MKKKVKLFSLLTPLVMSSCNIYTQFKTKSDVPENFFGNIDSTLVATNDTASIGAMPWNDIFKDTKLQALIEEGLANNTDLASAQLRVEEAEATLRTAKLALLPSFALAPQGNVSSFDGGKATQTYSLPVTASWEIDVFGRMRNARKQAKALYSQSQDYKQAVRSQLISSISNSYYTLLMLDEQLRISRETKESWAETVRATEALMEAGLANETAVSQMRAALSGINVSIMDLEEQINQMENTMAQLLSTTPRHIDRNRLDEQVMPDVINVGVPLDLLHRRPDVRAAERKVEQTFYAVNQARSSFYPQIVLSGSAGWTNSAGGMVQNPAKFLATAIGSITQPLFARGQLIGQLQIAKAQQEEATLAFQQTLLNAGIEVNDALKQCQTARQKADEYEAQIASLRKAYDSTRLLMDYGTTTYLEVLTAQQNLLSAQLSQTANRFSEIQSIITLFHALGGN